MRRCWWPIGLLLSCLFVGAACHRPPPPRAAPRPAQGRAPAADAAVPATEAAPAEAPLVGPIPDFAPLDAVRWNAGLANLAPDLPPVLTRLLGAAAMEEDDDEDDGSLIWMRDYHPILVRQADGDTTTVAYLAENPARKRLLNRRRVGPAPHSPADQLLPLIHENGNLVTNGRLVFVSERILEDNAMVRKEPALKAAGYRPRTRKEIVGLLAAALGRPRSDIIIVPTLPLEETQHVDVWLMFLDPRTAIVPQVHGDAIALLPVEEQPGAEAVAVFLDQQAHGLSRLGIDLVRLPMLPPLTVIAVDTSENPGESEALFFTPANGVLIAHADRRDAVLPEFDLRVFAPELATLQREYEQIWAREMAALGWTTWFVEGTALAQHLGLLRCVTAPIPHVEPPRRPATPARGR